MKNMISIAMALLVAACTASHDGGGGGGGGVDAPMVAGHGTIFTIVLENHDYAEIVGSSNAPYINSLISQGALATNYKDSGTHPSLPNYLNMISGNTQYPGFVDLDPTFYPFPVDKPNLGTQLEAANIKWRSYQESASSTCNLSSSGSYAPKHDPFLYFTDQQSNSTQCGETNVDYTSFAADLAAGTYQYMWITPNLTDDGHDPSNDPVSALTTSDTWLKNNVPAILASAAYTNGGVLFITWDEAEGRNGDDPDQIPMIVLSPKLKSTGMQMTDAMDNSAYLTTVEDWLMLPRLATVTGKPSMMGLFQ